MLRSHKTLSIVMTLCLCLALLAPVLVVAPADAASATVTVEQSMTNTPGTLRDQGTIKITVPGTVGALATGSQLTISWPAEVLDSAQLIAPGALVPSATPQVGGSSAAVVPVNGNNAGGVAVTSLATADRVRLYVPAGANGFASTDLLTTRITNSKFTVTLNNFTTPGVDGTFYIFFADLNASQFAGDFNVTCIGSPNSVFPEVSALTVGSVKSTGATSANAKSIVNLNASDTGGLTGVNDLDSVTVFEKSVNSMYDTASGTGANLELKIMTKGFEWATAMPNARMLYDWGFTQAGVVAAAPVAGIGGLWNRTDDDTLTMPAAIQVNPTTALNITTGAANLTNNQAGLIHLTGLRLQIDDSVAKVGDEVEIKIRATNNMNGFNEQTFVVAKYIDFGAVVTEGTTTELISGQDDQKIGEFYIEESAPNSLVANRAITMTLPEGYAWDDVNANFGASNFEVVNGSNIGLTWSKYTDAVDTTATGAVWTGTKVGHEYDRTLKINVQTASVGCVRGAKIKFKNLKITAGPQASGDVSIEVGGQAGATGTIKVATCVPSIKMEAKPVDVALGIQEQKVADLTITESKAGALIDDKTPASQGQNELVLQLDENFAFSKTPKVTVESGDITLDTNMIRTTGTQIAGGQLIIPIKSGSKKTAAVIKVSDIYVTSNRNAPEGAIAIKTAKDSISATNNTGIWNDYRVAKCTIANNAAVPPSENKGAISGGVSTFKVSSNIMQVNGLPKVMDAAPYVKNGRTYVPVRFLGYALGLSDNDIAWDSAAQKATFTKGDQKVELTIGSTTITVNGEAKTMDVAPELSGDRTMLPARFVAEALGAQVGWDAGTQSVVIEN